MNVLLISVKSAKPAGGIAVWTEHFLTRCQELDIQCHLVNTEISVQRSSSGKRHILDELLRTKRIYRDLEEALRNHSYDAAYLNTSCGPFGLFRDARIAKLIRKKNIPIITHYHCEIPYWVKRRNSVRCLGRLARTSQINLVLCQSSQNFLKDNYNLESLNIPNFVDASIVRQDEKEVAPTIKNIFFAGRICESKGAKELFDIAKQLPDISFRCAGNVGALVSSWDKPNNLHLLGHIPQKEIITQLDNSDLFLFPSHTEGSSIALIESMARGVPAIATNVGSNADVLKNGCGVIVEKGDVDAAISAIKQLHNPLLRAEISRKALRRVKTNYTGENIDKIINLLQNLDAQLLAYERKETMNSSRFRYLMARLLNRRPSAIYNSTVHKTASVGNGATLVKCEIGRYSYVYGTGLVHTNVGAFCSIAAGCTIGGGSHPIDWVSTSPVFYNKGNVLHKNFANTPFSEYTSTTIGNDVWIGAKSLIKGGVTVGDGAIVGMGSVVTKDVPPYEIWAGNPAKCIRKRFDDETIAKLLELKWWNWDEEKLHKYAMYFNDPQQLFAKLEEEHENSAH